MVPSLSHWDVFSLALSFVSASPLEESVLHRCQSVTSLTPEQVAAYKPYAYYASAGACQPSATLNWTCGIPCEANPDFKPVASGGNGDSVQFCLPILADLNIILSNLNDTLFPGVSSDIEVHSGFKKSQADCLLKLYSAAESILSYVKIAMSAYSTNSVTVVGHSLGGAIALLDGVYLNLQLPSASVSVISYGMPRVNNLSSLISSVGNQAFADYVDANVNVSHVNNKRDPVPILPWREIGYHHCSGEKHITDSNEWVDCPGQDNSDKQCIVGEVGSLLE
ncbi:lipase [Desarmillaria ectypa]|nr:lipase [Desarmillaria ectypa]